MEKRVKPVLEVPKDVSDKALVVEAGKALKALRDFDSYLKMGMKIQKRPKNLKKIVAEYVDIVEIGDGD